MRVLSPISGAIKGSAGNLIFQHYYGRTYGRSLPALFHYQPTPRQKEVQDKYYNVKNQWGRIYPLIKPYIPKAQFKKANPYDMLFVGIIKALNTFDQSTVGSRLTAFGSDVTNKQKIFPGSYTTEIIPDGEKVTFAEIGYATKVDFEPTYSHALLIDRNKKFLQYSRANYAKADISFEFDEMEVKSSDLPLLYYIALSDNQNFSNFFLSL